jgi:hypothetical protein
MNRLNLIAIYIISISAAVAISFAYGQERGTEQTEAVRYKAKKGFVEVNSVKYPVFVGIMEAGASRFGGITFSLLQKKHKQALLVAEKIKRYYLGKKIGNIILPKFKKVNKPDATAWSSIQCGKDNEGALAVVKVVENTVSVYLLPSCDEGVLAHIL